MGELTGHTADVRVVETPNTLRGSIADVSKRLSITGPCKVSWRDGIKQLHDGRYQNSIFGLSQSDRLLNQSIHQIEHDKK
jgi:hypothetical protein